MTTYQEATLVEGRVIVGHVVRFATRGEKGARVDRRGTLCETTHAGKQSPVGVVKVRDGTLAFVRFANVSPGKTIKQPGT